MMKGNLCHVGLGASSLFGSSFFAKALRSTIMCIGNPFPYAVYDNDKQGQSAGICIQT